MNKELFFFISIGTCSAIVHFVSLYCFVSLLGVSPYIANIFAFLVAFIVSFNGHYRFTFKSTNQKKNILKNLKKWFFTSLIGFILNQVFFVVGLQLLGEDYYALVWLIVTILITFGTFLLGKYWAFHQ